MTAGQQLIEQGIERGRKQGIQEVLLRQLRQRFAGEVDAHIEQRIAAASIEQIEAWSMRVLSAATLADCTGARRRYRSTVTLTEGAQALSSAV